MTLTAEPVTGHPFSFARLAQMLADTTLQEGVIGAGDLKVAQHAGVANMTVDVPAGDAWVQIDSGVRQGLRHVVNDATYNAVVTASHATLPRIDLVVLQYNDTGIPAGVGGDDPTIRVLAGTPTAGVTLDAPGASPAALPNDALLLAAVLVPAASTSVVTGNIRDRRKWARGARRTIVRAVASATYVKAYSAGWSLVDSANLQPRIECSGAPIRVALKGTLWINVVGLADLAGWVDGAAAAPVEAREQVFVSANTQNTGVLLDREFSPAAGSHLIAPAWNVQGSAGSTPNGVLYERPDYALEWTVEELIRPNADNS